MFRHLSPVRCIQPLKYTQYLFIHHPSYIIQNSKIVCGKHLPLEYQKASDKSFTEAIVKKIPQQATKNSHISGNTLLRHLWDFLKGFKNLNDLIFKLV